MGLWQGSVAPDGGEDQIGAVEATARPRKPPTSGFVPTISAFAFGLEIRCCAQGRSALSCDLVLSELWLALSIAGDGPLSFPQTLSPAATGLFLWRPVPPTNGDRNDSKKKKPRTSGADPMSAQFSDSLGSGGRGRPARLERLVAHCRAEVHPARKKLPPPKEAINGSRRLRRCRGLP
jgi:hypothetical protein